ncbi:cytochrome P450 [Sistotremastrum niveocremeum HHB9708]|uniref:Cytochrome P450 n=1 Tax=Sistotremastrum niveocremeum HHB9708 TaxID=1314777 RepID=A0A164PGZ2_9AGAM|nr:cytochrome P450 [Sistotremastrum niveocremeum HHB9708]
MEALSWLIDPISKGWTLCGLIIAIVSVVLIVSSRRQKPFPPGPRGSLSLGRKEIWRQYAGWAKEYGPVIYFKSNQLDIIVLNTDRAVHDLLGLRSKWYSDRPTSTMLQLVGQDKALTRLRSQDPRFSISRRIAREEMGGKAVLRHVEAVETSVKVLLKNLFSTPAEFRKHIRNAQSRSIMKVIYGYTVESDDDRYVRIIESWMQSNNSAARPGAWLVDSYPFLRFIPHWFPGAGFKKYALERRKSTEEAISKPLSWAKSEISAGRAYHSFVLKQLSSQELDAEHEDIIKFLSGTMYLAGVDTVLSAMLTFVLAMSLEPEVQKRAQKEIDDIVDSDRLPNIMDRERLPYVNALIKEVYRYHPPAPLAVPHSVSRHDTYDGMFIPKESIILPNIWAITHDESVYPNPSKFDPTRHLAGDKTNSTMQPDPRNFIFGFGRRVCAGMDFAELAIFLQISSILAAFNIFKERDAEGREIVPEVEYTGGIVSLPEGFGCRIVPRSEAKDVVLWDS